MTDLALRTPPELLVDARGHALRATWHPDDREVVLGVWDDRQCVGTVRLDPPATARLGAFLMASLGAGASDASSARHDGKAHADATGGMGAAAEASTTSAATRPTETWTDRWQRLRDGWLARLNR